MTTAVSFIEGSLILTPPGQTVAAEAWCKVDKHAFTWFESESSPTPLGSVALRQPGVVAPQTGNRFNVVSDDKTLQCATKTREELDGWLDFLAAETPLVRSTLARSTSKQLSSTELSMASTTSSHGGNGGGGNGGGGGGGGGSSGVQVDSHTVITALLNDAIKAEEFEKAVKYRKYRVLLDELKVAINSEDFDKCIELKKKKLELETDMPEIDAKKKQLEAAGPPTARKVASADHVSQSDDSDESVVKGGRLAAAATAKARLAGTPGTSSAAPSPTAAPAAAKPAVKLSAAELEARWAKFAPKAPARPAAGGGGAAAKDDSAVNRTSWDGGFTLQNAASKGGGGGGKKALEEDSESRQTLDESGDEVLLDKKDKKSKDKDKVKKKKKDKDAKAKKGGAPKKKMSVMSSTWAVDLGGASLAEMAKEKAKAKNARINTTTKTKKKKKKVKVEKEKNEDSDSMVSFKPGNNKLKALDDDGDTDLVTPKPAIKATNSKPQITGGLSRAADAPDAADARKAYEARLAMARTSNSVRDAKETTTPEKKSVGFFGTKKK